MHLDMHLINFKVIGYDNIKALLVTSNSVS